MNDFSPGVASLTLAADPRMSERSEIEVLSVKKARDWRQMHIRWGWAEEVYFAFEKPGNVAVASVRCYKKPSPNFSQYMDYKTTGWGTLAAADTLERAIAALYTGQGDLPRVARVQKYIDCIQDQSLVRAFDAQCRLWGLTQWGFHSAGHNERYCSILRLCDIEREQVDSGYIWLRQVPPEITHDS